MWSGISLKNFEESIYFNFYSSRDLEIIRKADDATLPEIKRLINKAKKIGDKITEYALEEMYDELLFIPPEDHLPLPPRSELEARFRAAITAAENRLYQQ